MFSCKMVWSSDLYKLMFCSSFLSFNFTILFKYMFACVCVCVTIIYSVSNVYYIGVKAIFTPPKK